MLIKPKIKILELSGDERKFILILIRQFSIPFSNKLGIEATEEAIIELIDNGFLKITTDNNNFWLETYNGYEYQRI